MTILLLVIPGSPARRTACRRTRRAPNRNHAPSKLAVLTPLSGCMSALSASLSRHMPGRLLRSPWPREALLFAGALERAGRGLLMARRGLSAGYGLTLTEWRMLRAIGQGPHEPSIAGLAHRTGMKRQNAYRTASALQRSGWLQFAPQSTDRRILVVSLTAAGERWLAALDSAMHALLLEMTNDLSPQSLELMSDTLGRVSRRLQACRSIVRASRGQRRRPHFGKTRHL